MRCLVRWAKNTTGMFKIYLHLHLRCLHVIHLNKISGLSKSLVSRNLSSCSAVSTDWLSRRMAALGSLRYVNRLSPCRVHPIHLSVINCRNTSTLSTNRKSHAVTLDSCIDHFTHMRGTWMSTRLSQKTKDALYRL